MDFSSSLDYLYGLQRFGVKLGLENMQALTSRLPTLRESAPCIHVAGTNGKGSVSVMLAEILKLSGLRVGLYTSPHLHCFTERIRIDGVPVTHEEVAGLAERIQRVAGNLPVTFFEATTAMALLAFQASRVDVAVIETGLGGRLDATNIVEPRLCMITPVSFDHSEHLGASLAEIAAEKAGIIKPGVPVVVGRQEPEALDVILSAAANLEASVSLAGREFNWRGDHSDLSVDVGESRLNGLVCALEGRHQLDNFAQAIAGALQLRQQGFAVTETAIYEAGRELCWPGRLEWLGPSRKVLLDVSHNLAGITCLANYLADQNISRIHLVTGLSGLRDPSEVLTPLVKYAVEVYAVPVSFGVTVSTTQVVDWADGHALPASAYVTAGEGLAAALDSARHEDLVVVCGSLYLAAELRQEFLEGGTRRNS